MTYLSEWRKRRQEHKAERRRRRLAREIHWYLYTRPFRLSRWRQNPVDHLPPPPEYI